MNFLWTNPLPLPVPLGLSRPGALLKLSPLKVGAQRSPVSSSSFSYSAPPSGIPARSVLLASPALGNSPRLEVFPVTGGHYNIGWDADWKDFETARHNSDFYTGKGPAGHDNGHLGVDIFGPRGTPIVAPVSGVVVRIGRNEGRGGNNVTIERDGFRFYMAHLDAVASGLRVGQRVGAGTPVGTLGSTGTSSAPHLHFSIYKGTYGNAINPFAALMEAHGAPHVSIPQPLKSSVASSLPQNRGPVLQNRELNPALIAKAVDILHQLSGQPLGTEVGFVQEGSRYVARLEMHGANDHVPRPHRAITLYHG